MGHLSRGGQESLTDSSIKAALWGEEVIFQVEMGEPLTEGMGSGCQKTPEPQMSNRDKLFELFMQKQVHKVVTAESQALGFSRRRAQVGMTTGLGQKLGPGTRIPYAGCHHDTPHSMCEIQHLSLRIWTKLHLTTKNTQAPGNQKKELFQSQPRSSMYVGAH